MRLRVALLAELRHRWLSALVGAGAVALAVSAVFVFVLLGRAAEDETRILQRDIGLNVLVLSDKTDLGKYYAQGFSEHSIPLEYVERLSDQNVANRLVPMIRRRVTLDRSSGQPGAKTIEVLLTGIGEEVFKGGKRMKAVFGMQLEGGEVVVGGEVARALALGRGDSVTILGESFRVTRTLTTAGSEEDVTVYANLASVQRLFGMQGEINEIQAIECHCAAEVLDPLEHLRGQLEELLPGTQVLRRAALADARRSQRLAAERLVNLATPASVLLAGLLIAALAWLNARERRAELGLLRTLGSSSVQVAGFVLGRTVFLGIAGALLGCMVGEWLAADFIPRIYLAAKPPVPGQGLLWASALLGAPLFAVLAALLPITWAVSADPADVLSHD